MTVHNQNILSHAMDSLRSAGFQKTQCSLSSDQKQELNVENGRISLLRSGQDVELYLSGIMDGKRASLSVNDISPASIDSAVAELKQMAAGSVADEAYDIAPAQPSKSFSYGPESADLDLMYDNLSAFLDEVKSRYPSILLTECSLDFTQTHSRMVNSNGIDFSETRGSYNGSLLFSAKEDGQTTSLNYTGFNTFELNRPFHRYGSIENLLEDTAKSLQPRALPEKFLGNIIITPDAVEDFIGFLTDSVGDGAMIANTSLYKDKLKQKVASEKLTLKSLPLDDSMAGGYPFTSDGFQADNLTLLDKGVLNSFLLSQYGSRKTGLERAVNQGGCLVLEPGNESLTDMIASIKEGIVLGRFSGGSPADKGDFSGIAKNSFYIKDGEIQYALSETMISGNMARILENIEAVSKETIDFGDSRMPWLKVSGVTIS